MNENNYLIEGPVPESQIARLISSDGQNGTAGALALFLGKVRADHIEGRVVSGIEYSAYHEMVEPVVQEIRQELFSRYSDLFSVDILHSTGLVKCGETSLAVVVTSGHRKQSFAALGHCVELIKEKLPVWKKEFFTDGTTRWIE